MDGPRWRVIESGPSDAIANMAVDEAILRGYSRGRAVPTFRIYSWRPSAISLGYSQDAEATIDLSSCRAAGVDVVRRITGGGAIYHQEEITYSLSCSREDLGIPERVLRSYRTISGFLINFYRRLGLDARYAYKTACPGERLGATSALCYAAKEKYDIVVGRYKLGGSAQKRTRDIIFQHGSIPIGRPREAIGRFLRRRSEDAAGEMSYPGSGGVLPGADPDPAAAGSAMPFASVEELVGRPADRPALERLLVESFCETFGVTAAAGGLSAEEERRAADLKERKYKSDSWTIERIDAANSLYDYRDSPALVGR